METSELYKIELKGLSDGVYNYDFNLDDKFFESVDASDIKRGDVGVHLILKKIGEEYNLLFELSGVVIVPCDRCLDDMEYSIEAENGFVVKYGDTAIDEGDKLIIEEGTSTLDLAWYLYEFVALELPLQHVHPDGECNAEMDTLLRRHSNEPKEEEESTEPVDSRWNELKKLIDNN